MISRRKSGLPWALVFVAVALGLFATVFTVVQGTAGRIRAVEEQKERQYVGVALANHSIDVARRLEGLEHAAHELAAVVIASPLITEAEFSALSAYLLADHLEETRGFFLPIAERDSEQSFLRFVGNDEVALNVVSSLGTSKMTETVKILGPYPTQENRDFLLVIVPVFLPSPQGLGEQFIGLSVLATPANAVFAASELTEQELRVAIYRNEIQTNEASFVAGDAIPLLEHPVFKDLRFANQDWTFGGVPIGGWTDNPSYLREVMAKLTFYGLILVAVTLGAVEFVRLRIRAERQLRLAIESLDDGFALFDNQNRLVANNLAYRKMLSAGEHASTDDSGFWDGVEQREIEKYWETYSSKGDASESRELSTSLWMLPDRRWVKASRTRVVGEGRARLLTDVTDLVRAKKEAEQANHAKSEFLSIASHELRTPLTVILGYASIYENIQKNPKTGQLLELLSENRKAHEAFESFVRDLARSATICVQSGKQLLAIVNDILDLSYLETNEIHIALETINLKDALNQATNQYLPQAEAKNLEIVLEQTSLRVCADPARLRQLLGNLLQNAIKFTDEGVISVKAIELGDMVRVEVSDTGGGIPEADQVRIFEKFVQGEDSTSRKVRGTGLGLAIAKQLVELMGGDIGVTSKVGEGSTFWFTLPKPAKGSQHADPLETAQNSLEFTS